MNQETESTVIYSEDTAQSISEMRIQVRNISGQVLHGCSVSMKCEQPNDFYRSRYLIRGENPEGKLVESIHEIDMFTGLTRVIASDSEIIPVRISVDRITKILPWWIVRAYRDAESGVAQYILLHMNLSFRSAGIGTIFSRIKMPLYPRTFEQLSAQIESVFESLRPGPSTIAATSIVEEVDMYNEAAQLLLEQRTVAIRHYLEVVKEHFTAYREELINQALDQLVAESHAVGGYILRSSGTPTLDTRQELAQTIRLKFDEGIKQRLKLSRGRPKGTSAFIDKNDFVARFVHSVFQILDVVAPQQSPLKKISMDKIERKLFSPHGDGREVRRHLDHFELKWSDLITKAMEAYEMKAFPEKLIP